MKTYLSERQKVVLETVYRQLSLTQSLIYLHEQGFECSPATLKRDKKFIKDNSLIRLYQLAKIDFRTQHLERKEKLELLEKGMWQDLEQCPDAYKRCKIREMIANLLPIISAYQDSTRYVLEKSPTGQEPNQSIST